MDYEPKPNCCVLRAFQKQFQNFKYEFYIF